MANSLIRSACAFLKLTLKADKPEVFLVKNRIKVPDN